ncbi:MAG: AEC family transporter [Kiritimatiellae bacterium]|nr:AEC family transporter [Kiritimatiellia bacterium]
MENFFAVARQVAVLFVLIGCGAALRRLKLVGESAVDGMVNLLILVVTPCIIVDVFQRPFDPRMLGSLGVAFVIAAAGHAAVIAASYFAVRHRDDNIRRPLMLAAVFSNAGFMGIPLEQALIGDEGVFYGIVYVAVFNLFMWSWGVWVMRGGDSPFFSVKMLVNPGTVGIAAGLPLFFFSLELPAVAGGPVHHLANLNTPMAMIVIGYYLAGARLGRVAGAGGVYVASFIRLLAYPLAMIAAMYPFRAMLDRNMTLAIVTASAAPAGAMIAMFAAKFKRDIDVSVAAVSGTTVLSMFTMPAVIAVAMEVL